MDQSKWRLDGSREEGLAAVKELFGLKAGQSFRDMKIPIEITEEQKVLLLPYLPDLQRYLDDEDIFPLLDAVEAKIQEVGYDEDHELNDIGRMLSRLCDELDEQN